jgi:hypothetical protein
MPQPHIHVTLHFLALRGIERGTLEEGA